MNGGSRGSGGVQVSSEANRETLELAEGSWIGVDVGGTKIDAVLIDAEARILVERSAQTGASDGEEAVVDRIAGVIRDLADAAGEHPLLGVGIGCPGQVNAADGVVRAAVNLSWFNVPLRDGLKKRLGSLPGAPEIRLANDVNALALGEYRFGVGRGARGLAYLAVGTGLGGGAIIDGKIVGGDNDFAMEVGHLSLRPEGRHCGCGMRGCPESYASGTGILSGIWEYLGEYPDSALNADITLTMPQILKAARAGDSLALKVIDEAGEMLGIVMAMCAVLLNPDLIVVGGGLGKAAADLLLPRAETAFQSRVLYPTSERVRIKLASVERAAVGAASLTMVT